MSLRKAVEEIITDMEVDKDEGDTTLCMVMKGYIGRLKTALSAAESARDVEYPYGGNTPIFPDKFPVDHRSMIERAKVEMRKEKVRAEGQEAYEEKMILCTGGPANGTMHPVPFPPPTDSQYCYVADARYRLTTKDGQQILLHDPPKNVDNKGGGRIVTS